MAQRIDPSLLCRRWVHAREEDTATEQVYRPADFPLPPSRGRSGFEFLKDGTFKRIGIGATDISDVKQGVWEIDNATADRLRLKLDGPPQSLEIKDLDQNRLTVKRAS